MSVVQLSAQAEKKPAAHRSDIQGLRALAVVAVVLFHAGLFLPGGFVGVDIFFVVSGFVITSSLLREHLRTGAIRLRSFYARRFKRLLPALALVVTVTTLVSSVVLSPLGPQQAAAITGIAAIFSLGNAAIALTTGDYFDSAAELNPLLHTWTLSVEEQFYFVFPVAIVLAIFLAKNTAKGAGIILIVGTSVSFALAMLTPEILKIYATGFLGFYSPITRAWEFGLGALIAWWLLVKPPAMPTSLARLAYMAGLLLIAAGFTSISATEHFPGPVTLIPVVGTVLTILGGHVAPWGPKDPLRSGPAVKVGDFSYSIYLWHWPFIAISGLFWPENPRALALAALLSVIPAIGSYYLLEQPIRYGHFSTRMEKKLLVALTLLIPVAVCATTWFNAEDIKARVGTFLEPPIVYEAGCHGPGLVGNSLSICEFNGSAGPPVYLVGDSHAAHFTEGVLEATTKADLSLSVFTASGCPLLDGVQIKKAEDRTPSQCGAWQEKALKHLATSDSGIVIIAAFDGYWVDEKLTMGSDDGPIASSTREKLKLYEEGLLRALDRISPAGHRVVLVHTVPTWTGDFEWALDNCTFTDTLSGCNQEMPLSFWLTESANVRDVLDRLGKASGASTVSFSSIICPADLCQTYKDGDYVYRDFSHLTNTFSAQLASEWELILDQARGGR